MGGPARASFGRVSHTPDAGHSIAGMTTTALSSVPPLTHGVWALDTDHTSVGFAIRHLGIARVRGHFGDVAAELVIGPDDCSVTATVAMASIDTGNATRDAHLRSADLLDVQRRPTMSYRSTRLRSEGTGWRVGGDLTIGDVTGPLTLAAELGGVEAFFDGTRHAGFEATGEIRRTDFGLDFGALGAMLGDVVTVELDLQFVEPA